MNSSLDVVKEDPVMMEDHPEDTPEEEEPSFRQKQRIRFEDINVYSAIKAQWKHPSVVPRVKEDEASARSVLQETLTSIASVHPLPKEEEPNVSPCIIDPQCILRLRSDAIQAIRSVRDQVMSSSTSSSSGPPLRWSSRNSSIGSSSNASQSSSNDVAAVQNTLLLVTGPTGSGKTHLLQAALREPYEGFYIRGKFDMLQHPDPYRVFTTAFSDWTQQVVARGPDLCRHIRDAIRDACGTETCLLVRMIPALMSILCFNSSTPPPAPPNPSITHLANRHWNDDASQRFAFVFPMFLRAITTGGPPIVLVVDDLQWSDPCSLDVLCSVVTEHHPGLFVVATYDGAYTHARPIEEPPSGMVVPEGEGVCGCAARPYVLRKLQEMEQSQSMVIQTVPIDNLTAPQVQRVLSDTFSGGAPEELCAMVLEQTQGNLFLLARFLQWLQEEHLLPSPLTQRKSTIPRTSWNMERMRGMVQDHTAKPSTPFFIQDRLSRLPLNTMDVLKVAACFGHSHMEDVLMEYVLDFPVHAILSHLADLGILVVDGALPAGGVMYSFQHDSWQRAVYDFIPESSRELFHLEIGRRLWRRLCTDELESNIYVILSQMIRGRRLITRATERYSIAGLCLHAGRKAAKSSTFRVATIYLNFGIELLGESGWREEYDLTLLMYNAAAEMAMCTAHFEDMEGLVESVIKHARSARDKLPARTTLMYALGVTDQQKKGLDLGLQLLTDLGFPLPKSFCMLSLFRELILVKRLLKGKSNCYLKRLPSVDNEDVLASLQILNLMFLHALLVRPNLAPFISLLMMKLTLTHGLSFIAPLAFASYGMLCIKLNDIDAAFRYGEFGIELLEQLQVREYIPRVYAAYYACIYPLKYPARDALDHLLYAHRVGLQTGDIEFSCLCVNLWSYLSMNAGLPLDGIDQQWTIFQKTMKCHRQKSLLIMSIPCSQLIKYFCGKDVDFRQTESILQDCIANNLGSFASSIYWGKAQTALIFNDWKLADEIAGVADLSRNLQKIPPTSELIHVTFLNGMIAFVTLGTHSKDKLRRSRRQYMREGKKMLRSLEAFSQLCPANFVDMKFLLEAELAAVRRQHGVAMERFICAIALAKDNGNFFIQALANERAGRYCFKELHQRNVAASYFKHSLQAYTGWAARRKVEHLLGELKEIYGVSDYKNLFMEMVTDSSSTVQSSCTRE